MTKRRKQPEPMLHLNPWVGNYLGWNMGVNQIQRVILYQDLLSAAGEFSGLSKMMTEHTLYGINPTKSVLVLHRADNFGNFNIKGLHFLTEGAGELGR